MVEWTEHNHVTIDIMMKKTIEDLPNADDNTVL